MAKEREIKNRIKSIRNTKKITSTMEMVSTAKMKKMQVRLEMSKPYELKINEVMANLLQSGISSEEDPHFREVDNPSRILVLQLTGNRGLCGSYNTNIIETTLNFKKKMEDEGREVLLYVVGKKGINYYQFLKLDMYKTMSNPEEKLTFDDASAIGEELRKLFISGEVHEVYVSYTGVVSSATQKPMMIRLLPITPVKEEEMMDAVPSVPLQYYFEPNPVRIFSYLLPLYVKIKLFTCFLESSYSEQFARRVAMKNATDASGDMIKELTITYNRARQAKITNEIAEIVGGAAALK